MYARVSTSTIQPGKIDEQGKMYQDNVLPEVLKLKGFKGVLRLANRETNKVMTIALWDTEADMKASESSGFYSRVVSNARNSGLLGQHSMDRYEVTLQV